jgi:large subunit ribosomal protein L3
MGATRITTQNLEVISVDVARGLILVKGAVPGSKSGYVRITDAIKKSVADGIPYPAGLKSEALNETLTKAEAPIAEVVINNDAETKE